MCMLFLFRCREWHLGKSGGDIRSEVEGLLSHTEKSSPTLLNRFKHQKNSLSMSHSDCDIVNPLRDGYRDA